MLPSGIACSDERSVLSRLMTISATLDSGVDLQSLSGREYTRTMTRLVEVSADFRYSTDAKYNDRMTPNLNQKMTPILPSLMVVEIAVAAR